MYSGCIPGGTGTLAALRHYPGAGHILAGHSYLQAFCWRQNKHLRRAGSNREEHAPEHDGVTLGQVWHIVIVRAAGTLQVYE